MRILHVTWSLDPHTGGPGNVIRNIVREQIQLGHEIAVVATATQKTEPRVSHEEFVQRISNESDFRGAELYLGRAYGRRKPWSTFGFSPECKRWICRRLSDRKRAADLIHIHGIFGHILSVAAARARRYSIPYVLRPCGGLDPDCLAMGSHRLKRVFARLILQKDLRCAAYVHAASQMEADYLCDWMPKERIRAIPHGVQIPASDASDASRNFLAAFPQLRGKRVILFMSRITPKKRPEIIVRAMARLRSEYPNLTLVLAGNDEGPLATVRAVAEEHGIENSIVYAGFLQGDLKRGAFAVADLFALPSMDENFGIAPLEAMAHGVPVLVTPGVASHVYVDESSGGLTVEGTAEGFAEGIRKLLHADREAMGRSGREFLKENLSWTNVARQIEDLYQEILANTQTK